MERSQAPVHIVADDRERAGGNVPAILAAREDVTVEIARLDVGDYQIERRIVVERKTAVDFAASLIDGRLFRQAAALATAPRRAVLVLEAGGEDWGDTGVRSEALQGALITIGVFYAVALLQSTGPEETARLLVYLGRQAQQAANGGCHGRAIAPRAHEHVSSFSCRACPAWGRSVPLGCWTDSAPCRPS
jgi:ERCC4-type nuclease